MSAINVFFISIVYFYVFEVMPRWVGVGGIFLARWKDLPVALTPRQHQVYSMPNAVFHTEWGSKGEVKMEKLRGKVSISLYRELVT